MMPGGQGRDSRRIDPAAEKNADWDIRFQPASDCLMQPVDQLFSPDALWIGWDRLKWVELELPVFSDFASQILDADLDPVACRQFFDPGQKRPGCGNETVGEEFLQSLQIYIFWNGRMETQGGEFGSKNKAAIIRVIKERLFSEAVS